MPTIVLPDELEEYNLTEENINYDYFDDENGMARISDYGLEPLFKLLCKLVEDKTSESKLVTIDRILNVVHQRSDIAGWFIEGGSNSLLELSA